MYVRHQKCTKWCCGTLVTALAGINPSGRSGSAGSSFFGMSGYLNNAIAVPTLEISTVVIIFNLYVENIWYGSAYLPDTAPHFHEPLIINQYFIRQLIPRKILLLSQTSDIACFQIWHFISLDFRDAQRMESFAYLGEQMLINCLDIICSSGTQII